MVSATRMRPTWDDTWMRVARDIARRSRCVRSAVGCVVIRQGNIVVSVGYNGPPAKLISDEIEADSGCDNWCPRVRTGGGPAFYDDCVSSHAETNALVRGDRTMFEGGTLYVTRVPCFTCAKVVANSGIARVVFPITDDDAEREPERSIKMLRDCGLDVVIRNG